ncbi:hypothetical protein E1A91_A08G186900v1 [Gossypium mustelinum]|uniref:26S proteasome non-ATPase regulatory subunit 2 homolog n=1 Tax=Gossypium mustelinum TaxID=34275 RepID=A0A5D2YC09_GOSMU|nr:hypothetical protein E1A91_A08G186900v1 [Gossypium mustelinum]
MAYLENGTGTTQTKPLPKDTKKKDINKEDLHAQSEEDLALSQHLELYVERIYDVDPEVQKVALESMRQEVRTSISSMTYVPKLLKFLRPHYGTLKAFYETMLDSNLKRILAREILQEYPMRQSEDASVDDLMELVEQIVAFHMEYNDESKAIDLLMENLKHMIYIQLQVDDLDPLTEHVDITNFRKTCLYLTSAARKRYLLFSCYDILFMDIAYSIYLVFYEFASALQIALSLTIWRFVSHVCDVFTSCDDLLMKKQFCYILARQGINFELDDDMVKDDEDRELSQVIINNIKLSESYLTLARNIEVMEPKCPEDVYKAHLLDGRAIAGANVDSVRHWLLHLSLLFLMQVLARLMTDPADCSSDGSSRNWLFKNKEHVKISVVASLGMILLWDVDSGLAQIDKYLHSDDNYVIAGVLLGVGLVNCSVTNDYDPALECLRTLKIGLFRIGLNLGWAGTRPCDTFVCDYFRPYLSAILKHENVPLNVIVFTAISLFLVYVGSNNGKVAQAIADALMDRSVLELGQPLSRLLVLALGLIYLEKQEGVEATSDVSKFFSEKMRNYIDITLLSSAHAGTRNVLMVQKLLGLCSHLENAETSQGSAMLGIAMVAMAEEAVVISLGLIGVGTNNARTAGMLRNLSSFYYKVRIAQGLVHMGKGLLTLDLYHSDRLLCSLTALAGLVTMLHACLDMKSIILGKYHFFFTTLMLMTLDKNLEPTSVSIRVGEAFDVVGEAGRPKTITGLQTHSTPVLLAAGERAELATEKYVPLLPILEGCVILIENTEYMEDN